MSGLQRPVFAYCDRMDVAGRDGQLGTPAYT